MNQRLCRERIRCPGSDSPFANLSSEANDPALFLGVRYCWDDFSHYPRICWSDVNTADALNCAANLCVLPQAGFPFGVGFGTPPDSTIDPPQGGVGPDGTFIEPLDGTYVGPPDAPPDLTPAPVQEPPGSDNYVYPPAQVIVWNEEQTCEVCIPDGPCFTYVCAAGTFYAIETLP